jgi:hypothetical protein
MTPEQLWRLHDTARHQGINAALELLHGTDGVVGPAGHAVLPAGLATRQPAGEQVDIAPLRGSAIVVLRGLRPGEAASSWLSALVWLRLGLSRGLLDAALEHLRHRLVDGAPLLAQQLVKGTLAEVTTAHLLVDAMLDGGGDPAGAHEELTRADRQTQRLLGAGGFTAEGPGRTAYLSELLAGAYATA